MFYLHYRLYQLINDERLSYEREIQEQQHAALQQHYHEQLEKLQHIKLNDELAHQKFIEQKQLQQQL